MAPVEESFQSMLQRGSSSSPIVIEMTRPKLFRRRPEIFAERVRPTRELGVNIAFLAADMGGSLLVPKDEEADAASTVATVEVEDREEVDDDEAETMPRLRPPLLAGVPADKNAVREVGIPR